MKQLWSTHSHERAHISRDNHSQTSNALFWSSACVTAGLAVIIGFFLHGGRHGLYLDDYTERAWAFDFAAGKWKLNLTPQFHIRPLAHILTANIGNAIPEHEFPVRIAIVAVHCLNVFLLGWLAYRLTGSFVVGTVSGTFFLFPIFGNEALLWFATSVSNTLSLTLLLIGFHCLLSCRSVKQDMLLFCCAVGAWILMVLFYESALFTLLLLPIALASTRRDHIRQQAAIWFPALLASAIPIGGYLALIERTDPDVISRGGATLNLGFILSRRIPEVSENFWWLVADKGRLPGFRFALISGPLREALRLGWRQWLSVPWGLTLMCSLLLGLCAIALFFPADLDQGPTASRLFKTAMIGLAWVALCLLPLILVKSQIVEIRTLYAPTAGFAMSVAALLGLAIHTLPRWRPLTIRSVVLMSGVVMFSTSLTMAGVVRTYQLRWYLDQKQLAALQPIISTLPVTQMLWLLPIELDEHSFSNTDRDRYAALEAYVYGVFETPYSGRDAVRLMARKQNAEAVTGNRWARPSMTSIHYSEGRPTDILIKGMTVPIQQLLPFTYQQGRVILLNPLHISSPNGKPLEVIDLPLVQELTQEGIETEPCDFQLGREN